MNGKELVILSLHTIMPLEMGQEEGMQKPSTHSLPLLQKVT